MNYGKDATEKRLQAANSRSVQIPLPDFSYLYKDLLRALSVLAFWSYPVSASALSWVSSTMPRT